MHGNVPAEGHSHSCRPQCQMTPGPGSYLDQVELGHALREAQIIHEQAFWTDELQYALFASADVLSASLALGACSVQLTLHFLTCMPVCAGCL